MVALELLRLIKQKPRITPNEMGHTLSFNTQYIRNTLRVLSELKLITTPSRGSYMITELGEHILGCVL